MDSACFFCYFFALHATTVLENPLLGYVDCSVARAEDFVCHLLGSTMNPDVFPSPVYLSSWVFGKGGNLKMEPTSPPPPVRLRSRGGEQGEGISP